MSNEAFTESNFIQEKRGRAPFFITLVLLLGLMLSYSAFSSWAQRQVAESRQDAGFMKVTNRDLSLFLWQNPQRMRSHQDRKMAYLPDFEYRGRVNIKPDRAEALASGPPELFYHYHLWKRLLSGGVFPRSISEDERREFTAAHPEWADPSWEGSQDFMQAFVGWKNFFKEGEAINAAEYSSEEIERFIEKHPGYGRHYWRNLLAEEQPDYLSLGSGESPVPLEQISPFLRVALYNWRHSGS